jgi:hypothetical protein
MCGETGLDAAVVQGRYDAAERFTNGAIANAEVGTLKGGQIGVWWAGPAGRLGFDLAQLTGTVGYNGHSQIGFPIRTRTRIGLDEYSLAGHWHGFDAGPFSGTLTAALGVRRIERRIAPTLLTTPLTEVLNWRFARLGGQAHWVPASAWFVDIDASVEKGLRARLAVDFHGVADATELSPGRSSLGHRLGVELGRELGPDFKLKLRIGRSRQAYGESESKAYSRGGHAVGQVHYPGSKQSLNQVMLTFEMVWP